MDREKLKKVPDMRVQDALEELYETLEEIHNEINKLKRPQYRNIVPPNIGSNT